MRLAGFAGTFALAMTALAATLGQSPAAGLDAPVHASWTRVPIRTWTARATSLAGQPVILDRRLDPGSLVTFTAQGESLREALTSIAAALGATVNELDSTIRLVPVDVAEFAPQAERDRTLRLARLPPDTRATLLAKQACRWPAGTRPRDLVMAWATEGDVRVEGLEDVPHDNFPAADLPPISLAERLDLVLAHFDRRVAWEGDRGHLVGRVIPIDAELQPAAQRQPAATKRLQPRPRKPPGRQDVFTLRLEAPLDQALAAIADRLSLILEINAGSLAAHGIAVGEIVRVEIAHASREQLLNAVVEPLGLQWKIEGDRLRVFAVVPLDTRK